jgi:hypothetical protein
MQKCKEDSAYIRSVEAAPEPMCILATDQQLTDLERFCTGDHFGIICIDPTFNLGPFYVTLLHIRIFLSLLEMGITQSFLVLFSSIKLKLFLPFIILLPHW